MILLSIYNICFSPTGGTKKVADILSGYFCGSAEYIDLNKPVESKLFCSEDICFISVPVYGGRVPFAIKDRILSLKGNGAKAVLVTVFGNRAIDDAMLELKDIAEECGFIPVAGVEAVAEHSLARSFAKGRPDTEDKAQLTDFAGRIKEALINNSKLTVPGNFPYKEYKPSPMKLYLKDTCVNCKKCARECPVGAISADNIKEVDGAKCFSCMRCVAVCPTKARNNAPELTAMFEEKLSKVANTKKENKLYL